MRFGQGICSNSVSRACLPCAYRGFVCIIGLLLSCCKVLRLCLQACEAYELEEPNREGSNQMASFPLVCESMDGPSRAVEDSGARYFNS